MIKKIKVKDVRRKLEDRARTLKVFSMLMYRSWGQDC